MPPSRTAVALDGKGWVGNRGLVSGRENDYTCSSAAHLDLDGNLICRADANGWIRGMAIDADGNVWAGSYNGMSVHKIDGTVVDTTQNPPRRKILSPFPNGVQLDAARRPAARLRRGHRRHRAAYTASPDGYTAQIDTKAMKGAQVHPNNTGDGIAIDKQNRVWFGGWHSQLANPAGLMHRLDPATGTILSVPNTFGVTAMTVHPDGTIGD